MAAMRHHNGEILCSQPLKLVRLRTCAAFCHEYPLWIPDDSRELTNDFLEDTISLYSGTFGFAWFLSRKHIRYAK